ncbi:MAG: hypothetical protein R3F61_06680 [Myxococcota bacterium]
MSIEPVEALLDAVADAPVLAEHVEAHLDAHPVPVDEAEVQRVADRLSARMKAGSVPERRARWPWMVAGLGLAAAAVGGFVMRPVARPGAVQGVDVVAPAVVVGSDTVQLREAPGALRFDAPRRTVTVAPDSRLLTSERGRTAVVLVQEGRVTTELSTVPEGHWVLLTRVEDGSARDVMFRDGEAPPPLEADVWGGTAVQRQLEEVRWESLPDRTLETLDALLEDR